jgi:glutamyl-Q tRNA(Asp) synthetase
LKAPGYIGRFAPSPTGALHAGSLASALASWLDARAHGGQWLVRIEDVDTPRCVAGADQTILQQLERCGLHSDAPVLWQSQRSAAYQQALDRLLTQNLAYPCGCSRTDVEAAQGPTGRHQGQTYPGTCRAGLQGKPARAWRLHLPALRQALALPEHTDWHDRRLGPQSQDVAQAVGDFVLKRADGLWAYQLAVVVDDAEQGITQVVRGQDLADNTARQILLQRALGLPTPEYLHTPLVLSTNGEKLSKQNGAQALDLREPMTALNQAAAVRGLSPLPHQTPLAQALQVWVAQWQQASPTGA